MKHLFGTHILRYSSNKRKHYLTIVECYKNGNMMRPECPEGSFPHLIHTFPLLIFSQCLDDSTHDLSILLEDGVNTISSISTKKGKPSVLPYDLAKRWGIGLETAKKTLLHTTQSGLHTAPNPLLSQRYRTNDQMFRYKRLSTDIFTDTMLVRIKSHRGNTCTQIYTHRNTWCKAYPMKTKEEAHHLLSLLFPYEGVLKTLIMDGAKEQVMDEFHQNTRQADCQVKQMEPYSPWENAAEATIKELKKGTGRKMIRTGSPKVLWDDCLELEAEIWSSTASNIFELEGEVPKTVMNGETTNITQLCEFGWYDWVYFHDNAVTYPDDKWVLGQWLGPSIGVGPTLCAKLLKGNGQRVYRSSYQHLTEDEVNNPEEVKKRDDFNR